MDRFYIDDDYCGLVYDKETNTYFGNETSCELLNKNDKEISDLEAKLAEKEAELEDWKDGTIVEKLWYLERQLTEKEKEIDNLYNRLNSKQKFYEMSIEKDYKEYLSRLDKLEKQCDQDKISFAVEQLEKVKETLIQNADEIGEEYKEDYFMISLGNAKRIVDNQIEQLKKEKK